MLATLEVLVTALAKLPRIWHLEGTRDTKHTALSLKVEQAHITDML